MQADYDRSQDEVAIGTVFQQLGKAWNRGDGEAYGAQFEEEADYVVFNGAHLKGRREIAAVHQQLFDTVLKGTRLPEGAAIPAIRFLSPEVALVHSTGGVRFPGQDTVSPTQDSIQTFVLVKREEGWRISAFQNTRIQPPASFAGKPHREK